MRPHGLNPVFRVRRINFNKPPQRLFRPTFGVCFLSAGALSSAALLVHAFVRTNQDIFLRDSSAQFWRIVVLNIDTATGLFVSFLGLIAARHQYAQSQQPRLAFTGFSDDKDAGLRRVSLLNTGAGRALLHSIAWRIVTPNCSNVNQENFDLDHDALIEGLEELGLCAPDDFFVTRISPKATVPPNDAWELFRGNTLKLGSVVQSVDIRTVYRGIVGDAYYKDYHVFHRERDQRQQAAQIQATR